MTQAKKWFGARTANNQAAVKLLVFGAMALLLLLTAVFANSLAPYDPNLQNVERALLPPSFSHFFGTDRYGRDLFSRVIAGARTSIFSTVALVAIISITGTFLGIC